MRTRLTWTFALILALAPAAFAGEIDFVIPASASTPASNGGRWQSEISLVNAGSDPVALTLAFHDGTGKIASSALTLSAHSTTSIADVVQTRFGNANASGAITIDVTNDALIERIAVTSRTANVSAAGEFGQDIPASSPSNAIRKGESAVITGPSNAASTRLNFGLFANESSSVRWSLLRANGTNAKTITVDYAAGVQVQYTRGITTFFGVTPEANDTVRLDTISGAVIPFGSAVNNATEDPSFVVPGRVRERSSIEFLGVDIDENGTVDIIAKDGVLDATITLYTSMFPNYFKVIAVEPSGKRVSYELVNAPVEAQLIDDAGTIQWYPGSGLRGTSGSLTVRATDGFQTAELLIPVRFN